MQKHSKLLLELHEIIICAQQTISRSLVSIDHCDSSWFGSRNLILCNFFLGHTNELYLKLPEWTKASTFPSKQCFMHAEILAARFDMFLIEADSGLQVLVHFCLSSAVHFISTKHFSLVVVAVQYI